ncbi:MAG TPA: fibronectin type III domain-containing protein [Candidatus Dormibacteraeota bacterium]|nr:fibronectin type III domain-containing protein [Candidatus Dormibacteraeota bacterium]
MEVIRRLILSAAAAAVSLTPLGAFAAAPGVPVSTSSFYVFGSFIDVCGPNATTECPLYNDAATETIPATGGMTILDFGAPCFAPATRAWGIQLLNSQSCTPDSTVVVLAQAWLRGYEANPNRSASPPYVLVVGTSNSLTAAVPGNVLTHAEMASHGQAWFTSVIAPVAAAAQSASTPVTIWAGDDIEQSSDGNWYDGATTSAWVDAYAAASGAHKPCAPTRSGLLANYGDYVPNEPGWSPAAVYHVSWQSPPACPVPEIYLSANASEWQSLNRYAVNAGLPPMQFVGVLSEDRALGSLSKSASWTALANTTGQLPQYLSVIPLTGRIQSEVPDAPSSVTASAGPGYVMLGWSAPAWDGGAAITTYTVSVYAGATRAAIVRFSGFPAPEMVIVPGLAGGIEYRFMVSAGNRIGTGPQSFISNGVVPAAPARLR